MALHTWEFTKRLESLQERMRIGELADRNYRLLNLHLAIREHIGAYRERPKAEDLLTMSEMLLDEELKWSHADKMTIIDYPFTSETQEEVRQKRHRLVPDVIFGDRRGNGKRTTSHTDEDGAVHSSKSPITLPFNEDYALAEIKMIARDALDNAGITQRQREAIELVFYRRMTQEDAARLLGVRQHTLSKHIKLALESLRIYLKKIGITGDILTV